MLKKTVLGAALLAVLSLLFMALLACYVELLQPESAAPAPLTATIDKAILWPGEATALSIHYLPAPHQVSVAYPQAQNLVLLIDTSGSMAGEPLNLARLAAIGFLKDIGAKEHRMQVAVCEFADQTVDVIPPTTDIDKVSQAIANFQPQAGVGTAFLPALQRALQLLGTNSGGLAVLLSDGGAGESLTDLRTFFAQAWRPSAHKLFLLGIGEGARTDTMLALTDDPGQYLVRGLDVGNPTAVFQEVAERIGMLLGTQGQLTLPLSTPLIHLVGNPAAANTNYDYLTCGSGIYPQCAVPLLFDRPYHWRMLLKPRLGGVLPLLHAHIRLKYANSSGQFVTLVDPATSPLVLAITPGLLLAIFAPSWLYVFANLIAWWLRPRGVLPELPASAAKSTPPPAPLPPPVLAHPALAAGTRIRWTPTLVLGLGRSGRQVLTHLQQALEDTQDVPATRPVLLALDVARDEIFGTSRQAVPACLAELPNTALCILPESACQLHIGIGTHITPQYPDAELDVRPYCDWGVDKLSLRKGSNGEAPLARLALLNDLRLGVKSVVYCQLETHLATWRLLDPEGSQGRQIIIVFNAEGGVGRGWITELLFMLRQLVTQDASAGIAVKITVLLLGQRVPADAKFISLQQDVLADELDRLTNAGRLSFRHVPYGQGEADLKYEWIRQCPHDEIYVMTGQRETWDVELFPNAAEAMLILMDATQHRAMLGTTYTPEQVTKRRQAHNNAALYNELSLRIAAVPRSFYARLLAQRLMQIVLGSTVLCRGMTYTGQAPLLPIIGNPETWFADAVQAGGQVSPGLLAMALATPTAASARLNLRAADPTPEHIQQLLLALQQQWGALLQQGKWNLATLAQVAQRVARNLNTRVDTSPALSHAVTALDNLAAQALLWVNMLLGSATMQQLATTLGTSKVAGESTSGLFEQSLLQYSFARQRLEEWSANPSRQDVVVAMQGHSTVEAELMERWLSIWLDCHNHDIIGELRQRCYWEIATNSAAGQTLELNLVFIGSTPVCLAPRPASAATFMELINREVSVALAMVTATQLLPLLAWQCDDHVELTTDQLIRNLKGALQGDQAPLRIAVPRAEAGHAPEVERMRASIARAVREQTGAAEVVRLHEAADPLRLIALRLLPLRLAPIRRRNPSVPVHRIERHRRDYGHALARDLGLIEAYLPPAAGIALDDAPRLVIFAGLWLAGKIAREVTSGLFFLQDSQGKQPLTIAPEEGLADAAARFVATDLATTAPTSAVTDCNPHERTDLFEALLCWLWAHHHSSTTTEVFSSSNGMHALHDGTRF